MKPVDPRVLLDFTIPFDQNKVEILDYVIEAMFNSNVDMQTRDVAHKVLAEFKSFPDAWRYVGLILQNSKNDNTKFFALQILEACIQTRWNVLPENEKLGIKQYISDLVIKLSSNNDNKKCEQHFVNKVNENLVQIVKQEWPDKWPTFIQEICKSSRTSQSICENNMRILNLLSEEIFDFGTDEMASKNVKKLMSQMAEQFQEIFDLCMFILNSYINNPSAVRESLVKQNLVCLAHFLRWIPFGYIFETDLIDILMKNYMDKTTFRIECLKCLTEICSLNIAQDELPLFKDKLTKLWLDLVDKLRLLPKDSLKYNDVKKVPPQLRIFWETFYSQLALCLTAYLKNYLESIAETSEDRDSLLFNLKFLVEISSTPHDETFKICLDFWNYFCESLVREFQERKEFNDFNGNTIDTGNFDYTMRNDVFQSLKAEIISSNRLNLYQGILDDVRRVMISKMAKPQEIYIQFDEDTGEVVREYQLDTDEIALYNSMKNTLILLTILGEVRMEKIMMEVLHKECEVTQSDQWNPTTLNRLCYSIGSISGAMNVNIEKPFLIEVLKPLLNLCESKRGKGNKAIVASCIMYIVGQYPRFLRVHFKFLRTVVRKLLEFMLETFPGVQDMACETFLKISQKCKHPMVAVNPCDGMSPLVEELIQNIQSETKELNEKQILLFFEAVAYIISAAVGERKIQLLNALMQHTNLLMREVMSQFNNHDFMCGMDAAKKIVNILRINRRVAKALGSAYGVQLAVIYQEMLEVYKMYSNKISLEIQKNGPVRFKHADIKVLHLAKRETLHLVETFVDVASQEDQSQKKIIVDNLLGPLLQPVLEDYRNNLPETRDHEVLSLLSVLMIRLDSNMSPVVSKIFEYVFDCTLEMIKQDFHSYPDHREKFYELLKVCCKYCFDGLFSLPSDRLKSFIESLVWAFKHEHPKVAEEGLQVTYDFLKKLITEKTDVLHGFCKLYYFSLMKEILSVLTDTLHRSGFKYQTLILMNLLRIIEFDLINDPSEGLTKENITHSLCELLCRSFITVNKRQVEAFVVDLFNFSQSEDPKVFQVHVRDFLISLKKFSGNNDELFEIERQEALNRAAELEKKKIIFKISGMLSQKDAVVTVRDIDDE